MENSGTLFTYFASHTGVYDCPRNCKNMETSINLESEHCPISYIFHIISLNRKRRSRAIETILICR